MVKKKVIAIVQARCSSVRLPNKVLKKINGIPLIEILYSRLSASKKIDEVIIATTKLKSDKKLINFLNKKNIKFFCGDENNVLKRYYDCALKFKADVVVRITGDGPLVDSKLTDTFIKKFLEKKIDYLSNQIPVSYPDGLDIEVFSFKALKKCFLSANSKYDKEHVTPFIIKNKFFKKYNITLKKNFSKLRWSVDEQIDLNLLTNIFKKFEPNILFSWKEVLNLIQKNKKKLTINSFITRNEGSQMKKSQKLWKRAKQIIPGGNMFLSKRPELYHPRDWPKYYKKAKGCTVWDLEGKKFTDLSLMGVGCNILGYSHTEVDNAVIKAIKNSNNSTLNCYEDVQLCEKILDLHSWADSAKLARTGGEASAIAVRIARAASGKSKIAFCGYHGWHDWYLSANIENRDGLKNHLMGGLDAKGVPKSLKNTSFPFTYNNFDELREITERHDIGVVKMEVSRNFLPKDDFLIKVRNLCNKKNIILIFDECTSGFRQTNGGLHKLYKVNPDIAWFGKSLGNGFSISAIIGKKEIMEHAQDSFMSSTFWSERSGPAAAIKTLEVMEKLQSWKYITNIGKKVQINWKKIAKHNGIPINILGIPALSSFSINSNNWLKYKTYITQEMLKKGFLASNAIFASISHNQKNLNEYFDNLDHIFAQINKFENETAHIDNYLEGPICQSGFQRLN